MMGTGKTVSGMMLAERLELSFADLDDMIVYRLGMPITQVFITVGEKVFRSYETDILRELVWQDNIVISCGGGVSLSSDNMKLLDDFIKVRLTASPETIYDRIKDDFSRPLIKDNTPPALQKLIDEREASYSSYADITVSTDNKSVEDVVAEIEAKLLNIK
jgi:shikimate kinase